MFQLFSKRRAEKDFKARSDSRDFETDRGRIAAVLRAVEDALSAAKAEQAGLKTRIDDVLARASVTIGNDVDEYLTRPPEESHLQDLLGNQIASGQRRLNELATAIGHFGFLRTALLSRFPEFKLSRSQNDTASKAEGQ
jgi:hypothetical protein